MMVMMHMIDQSNALCSIPVVKIFWPAVVQRGWGAAREATRQHSAPWSGNSPSNQTILPPTAVRLNFITTKGRGRGAKINSILIKINYAFPNTRIGTTCKKSEISCWMILERAKAASSGNLITFWCASKIMVDSPTRAGAQRRHLRFGGAHCAGSEKIASWSLHLSASRIAWATGAPGNSSLSRS